MSKKIQSEYYRFSYKGSTPYYVRVLERREDSIELMCFYYTEDSCRLWTENVFTIGKHYTVISRKTHAAAQRAWFNEVRARLA